jgi:hypothetical protein
MVGRRCQRRLGSGEEFQNRVSAGGLGNCHSSRLRRLNRKTREHEREEEYAQELQPSRRSLGIFDRGWARIDADGAGDATAKSSPRSGAREGVGNSAFHRNQNLPSKPQALTAFRPGGYAIPARAGKAAEKRSAAVQPANAGCYWV